MSFVNIGGLFGALGLGALAASVPLIIHILNRRRFKIIEWAAMRFLLDAQRQNRRRVLLEQLLLLLLRMLLAALIAWIVLRPLLPSAAAGRLLGGQSQHIWIVDDSRSMGATTAGAVLIERSGSLLEAFAQQLAERSAADSLTVLRTSRPQQTDLLRVQPSSEAARDQISAFAASLAAGDGGADLAGALAAAVRLAAEAPAYTPIITIVGDSCLADLRDLTTGGGRADLLEAARAASEVAQIRYVDLAATGSRENVGIVNLLITEGNVIATAPVSLQVEVHNFGTREVHEVTVAIKSDSITRTLPPIKVIAPGASETVELPFAFRAPGSALVRASLAPDRFTSDDEAVVAVDVLAGLDLLVVDGEGGESADAGDLEGERARSSESWFLRRALAPAGPINSGVRVEVASIDRFAGIDLSTFSAIVLANVFRIDPEKVTALHDFVNQGGGLIIMPGDQTDPTLFARDFYRDGAGLAPASLGRLFGDPTGSAFGSFIVAGGSHPVTALFAGENNPFAQPVKLYAWYELAPAADSSVLLLTSAGRGGAALGAGVPLLVERAFGKGRVLLFGIPADDEWTNWPGEPSYLVTMQEALRHVAPRRSSSRNLALGAKVVRPIDPSLFDTHARLRLPRRDSPSDLTASRVDDVPLAFDLGALERAGAYILELTGRDGRETIEHYSVSAPAEEGDLRRADAAALANLLPGIEVEFIEDPEQLLASDEEANRAELWRPFVLLAIAAVLIESFLAWWFGRSGRPRRMASPATGARA